MSSRGRRTPGFGVACASVCLIVGFVGHGEQVSGPSPRLTRPAFKMGNVTKPEKPNVSDRLLTRKA